MAPKNASPLREYLRSLSEGLADAADNLWRVSKVIHDHQNKPGSNTENGRAHIEAVEENIWRLLCSSTRRGLSFNLDLFDDAFPVFLLSAAACCHDFDKATDLPPSVQHQHGQGSADIVRKNEKFLGLIRPQSEAIQEAIRIHDLEGDQFLTEVRKLQTKHPGPQDPYNLQLITVLLKAADILHTDNSRILGINISDPEALMGIERKKYLFRHCTHGWYADGTCVVIGARPGNPKEKSAVSVCFNFMKTREWPSVEFILELTGFPYELVLKVMGNSDHGTADVGLVSTGPSTPISSDIPSPPTREREPAEDDTIKSLHKGILRHTPVRERESAEDDTITSVRKEILRLECLLATETDYTKSNLYKMRIKQLAETIKMIQKLRKL